MKCTSRSSSRRALGGGICRGSSRSSWVSLPASFTAVGYSRPTAGEWCPTAKTSTLSVGTCAPVLCGVYSSAPIENVNCCNKYGSWPHPGGAHIAGAELVSPDVMRGETLAWRSVCKEEYQGHVCLMKRPPVSEFDRFHAVYACNGLLQSALGSQVASTRFHLNCSQTCFQVFTMVYLQSCQFPML